MKVVLDTNVFVSGVFFSGPPAQILEAWSRGAVSIVVSPEILQEYFRVGRELRVRYPGVELEPALALLSVHAEVVAAAPLAEPVCEDPDDDKFLACARSAGVPSSYPATSTFFGYPAGARLPSSVRGHSSSAISTRPTASRR